LPARRVRSGFADGTGTAAQFNLPAGLAVDAAGNVYVADYANNTIRKITPAGVVTTFAGNSQATGSADGTGTSARFFLPTGIAVDASGNLYVVEQSNNTMRMITPAGVVSTLAGFAGVPGSEDGTGPAARFFAPTGVAVDAGGNLYVADEGNNTIRKGSANGAPQIQAQPTDQYAAVGGSATFSVTASGSGTLTYQWAFNGTAISGATGSTYTVANAQASNSGQYTVTVTNSNGSVTSSAGNLYVNTGSSGARLINIATRALVGTGGNVLIPGFVDRGRRLGDAPDPRRRAGPDGVRGLGRARAAEPHVTAQSDGRTVATNTGWGTNANPAPDCERRGPGGRLRALERERGLRGHRHAAAGRLHGAGLGGRQHDGRGAGGGLRGGVQRDGAADEHRDPGPGGHGRQHPDPGLRDRGDGRRAAAGARRRPER
jgi:hypothetical protein